MRATRTFFLLALSLVVLGVAGLFAASAWTPSPALAGSSDSGWLGVVLSDLTSGVRAEYGIDRRVEGALVTRVLPDSPAERAGLKKGDVIVELDNRRVDSVDEVVRAARALTPGDKVLLVVDRNGTSRGLSIRPGDRGDRRLSFFGDGVPVPGPDREVRRHYRVPDAPRVRRAPRAPEAPRAPRAPRVWEDDDGRVIVLEGDDGHITVRGDAAHYFSVHPDEEDEEHTINMYRGDHGERHITIQGKDGERHITLGGGDDDDDGAWAWVEGMSDDEDESSWKQDDDGTHRIVVRRDEGRGEARVWVDGREVDPDDDGVIVLDDDDKDAQVWIEGDDGDRSRVWIGRGDDDEGRIHVYGKGDKPSVRIHKDDGDKPSIRIHTDDGDKPRVRVHREGDAPRVRVYRDDDRAREDRDRRVEVRRSRSGGFLGVETRDLGDQLAEYFDVEGDRGVLITRIVEDSPAEKAGLAAGDVIVSIDGETVESAGDLRRLIRAHDPEETVDVEIVRRGAQKRVEVRLADVSDFSDGGWSVFPEALEGLGALEGLEGLKGLEGLEALEDLDIDISLPDIRIPGMNIQIEGLDPAEMEELRERLEEQTERLREQGIKLHEQFDDENGSVRIRLDEGMIDLREHLDELRDRMQEFRIQGRERGRKHAEAMYERQRAHEGAAREREYALQEALRAREGAAREREFALQQALRAREGAEREREHALQDALREKEEALRLKQEYLRQSDELLREARELMERKEAERREADGVREGA